MENTKKNYSVKSKLISAIAMLLVATIMLVSSTYAWFTLSTKPEVSGISTAVGANGALEMLLATQDEDGNWVYGTGEVGTDPYSAVRNTYWGNLVDLSFAEYGSGAITLYPALLNVDDTGAINTAAPIKTPSYGADGRVEEVKAGGMFGLYNKDDSVFLEADNYGFRAVGVASGLSAREQAFRVAISQILVNGAIAQVEARNSLSQNGDALAGIAIKKAVDGTAASFESNDIAAVGSMIEGVEKALAAIENAYLEIIYATIQSSIDKSITDEQASAAAGNAKNAADGIATGVLGDKVAAALTAIGKDKSTLASYDKFEAAVASLTTAQTEYAKIADSDSCTWTQISAALYPLVDIDNITINTYKPEDVMDNKDTIASQVFAGKGLNVVISTGGGVFADIADYAGDYTVGIKIDTSDLGATIEGGVDATMKADTTLTTTYLTAAKNTINANPPAGDSADKPITEFYGYAIDLAFRTNASTSNLLLQTAPADRIYTDNQNEQTMGKGSTMTFSTTDPTFTQAKMLNLMSKLKVAFYETESGKVLGYAKLDTNADNVTGTAVDGITANLYIVEEVTEEVTEGETTTTKTTEKFVTEPADAVITELGYNTIHHVTVLVYLDGETIENKDVAAIASDAKSMSGTFNMQFASSANLKPMEYSNLHQTAPAADDTTQNG